MLATMRGVALDDDALSGAPRSSSRLRAFPGARDYRIRSLLGVLALAAVYYGAAQVGYAFEFAGPVAAIVWFPVGVGIAALYLGGLRFWPGVAIGDLLANDYSALPIGSALGQTLGNVLEVLVVAILLRRLVRDGSPLDSIGGLGRMLVAIAAGTAVSASIGSLSLLLGGVINSGAVPNVWRTWWLGDSSGALIVVPLAIAWYGTSVHNLWRDRKLEAVAILAAVAGLSELGLQTNRPLAYLVFPALIWAALRFGQRGATLAVAVAAGFTVWETVHYEGPFVFHSIAHSVLSTQLYLAVASMSTLCLAAVVSERERFAERLAASRARLVVASTTERKRLEHNLHDGAQQRLTALYVRLGSAAEQAAQAPANTPDLFKNAQKELSLAIDELRELAHGIDPPVLTALGLAEAIRHLAARSPVPVHLLALPSGRVDDAAQSTAYYVVAEGLTNAQKYAQASSISVRASLAGRLLYVEVADDGMGGADESAGAGLQGLRDRVEAIGGTFEVESTDRGTRIAAAIPATPAGR
jgi:signal transduction histidine kinase